MPNLRMIISGMDAAAEEGGGFAPIDVGGFAQPDAASGEIIP
jgi:hypothetical protein